MSDVQIPPQGVRLVHDDARMSLDWYRYMRELHQYSGLSGSQFPLWNRLPLEPMESNFPSPSLARISSIADVDEFTNASTGILTFRSVLPHGYPADTAIKPIIRWAPSTAGSGEVRWILSYIWWPPDGSNSPGSVAENFSAPGQQRKHVVSQLEDISGSKERTKGTVLFATLTRDFSKDSYTGSAYLLALSLHAQNRALGTTEVT